MNFSTEENYRLQDKILFTDNPILRIICALLLRAGFILVQVGSIPVENVYIIILHNVIDIALAILSYIFVGFQFSFGEESILGIIGYGGYIWEPKANVGKAALGVSSCLIGTAIISTYIVARVRHCTLFIITLVYCMVFLPILMHSCWTFTGILSKFKYHNTKYSLQDYGGGLVIFIPSALIGLMGALFLGRRILKLKNLDQISLGNEYVTGTITGYILIMIGYMSLTLPCLRYNNVYATMTLINCLVAMATGILTVAFCNYIVHSDILKYWTTIRCLQGGIAGIMSVVSGIDTYNTPVTLGIACVASILFFIVAKALRHTALEDPCNLSAIHIVCNSLGLLIPPILGNIENFVIKNLHRRVLDVMWQFACAIAVATVTVVFFGLIIFIFWAVGCLRNQFEEDNHKRAVVIAMNLPKPKSYLGRLFKSNDGSVEIEPGKGSRVKFSEVVSKKGTESDVTL